MNLSAVSSPMSAAAQFVEQGGQGVVRLNGDVRGLLRELPRLGRVLCVTGNPVLTHEHFGCFTPIEFYQDIGVVMGPDIDLRLYVEEWRHGFAVTHPDSHGGRPSFQFFDAAGAPVHQVIVQAEGNASVYEELVERFRAPGQSPPLWEERGAVEELPDSAIDLDGFHRAWRELEDTANFVDILKRFGLRREQALRLAPPGHARRVGNSAIRMVLEQASLTRLPIMIFVRSPGCIQIHTGRIQKIKMFGRHWLNVLDPAFHLHLKMAGLHSTWVVSKPTIDGAITSLELFDAAGENVALLFGKRGYGKSERLPWREMLRALE